MPLYEYQCEQCGERFEVIEKFADDPLTTHENCGGNVHRLISTSALKFKGSGWYVTDYAKGGEKTADKPDKAADNGSGKKADTPANTPSSGSESGSSSSTTASESKSETKSSSSDTK